MIFATKTLKIGKYRYSDGTQTVVTRERLRGFARNFRRMTANNYHVPCHLINGGSDSRRSARNTVGTVADLRLAPSGDALKIKLDLFSEDAIVEALAGNLQSHPFVAPQWQDGRRNKYSDVITVLDLRRRRTSDHNTPAISLSRFPILGVSKMPTSDKITPETIDAMRGLFRILPDHIADEVAQYVNELWPGDSEEICDRTLNGVADVSVEEPEFASMSMFQKAPLTKAQARKFNDRIAAERKHMFARR